MLLAVTLYCDGEPLLSATLCVPAERRTDTAVNTGASKFKAIYHPETPFLLYIDADTQISFSTECSPAEEPFPAMTRYTVFSEKEAVRGLLFEPGYIPVKEGESVEIDLSQTELVQQCADIRVNCGSYCMILYYAQHPDAEQMTFPVLVGEEGKELPVRYCWGGIEPACAVTRLSADTRKWEDYGRFDFLCTDTGKIGVYPMGAKAGSYRAIVVWQETIAGKYYSEYSVDFPFFVQYRYASEGIW